MFAARFTALASASVAFVAALLLVGSAGGAPPWKQDKEPPSAPANVRVAAATATSVSIQWDASTDNVGVASYYVYGDGLRARVSSPSYVAGGRSCGESFYVWIIALDRAGNHSASAGATVSTVACVDTQAPSPPTGFRQAATTQSSVLLEWSASADNVGVVGYGVFRSQLSVVAPVQPAATLTGLSCGSTVEYSVDAVDAAGNRSARRSAWVTTAECSDGQPPSTPQGLTLTSQTSTSLSLSWSPSSDNVAVAGYRVTNGGVPVATGTQTSASVPGLTCNTAYVIGVDASDAAGNRSSAATINASTSACPTPPPSTGGWTVCATEGQQCSFTGTKEVRYGANGIFTPPRVFTSSVACTNGVFGDPLQGVGKHCEYRDASGSLPPPPSPSADTIPPSQPTNLAVAGATTSEVSLTWSASSDNVGVTGYAVDVNGANVLTASQPRATVPNLGCGKAFTFEVDAFDAAGNRSTSNSVTSSTAACADTQPPTAPANVAATSRTATSIALSWSASGDNVGVTGYGLYRGGAAQGSSTGTTGIFSGLSCNTNYTLAVDAYDGAGNRSSKTTVMVATTACSDTTPPSAPTGLAASSVVQTGLSLGWNASSDNVGVTGYDVYRNGTKTASVASLSSSQTGLICGTSYQFGVVARDAAGNSSPQAPLAASTSACPTVPPPTSGWTLCAMEGLQCSFTGTKEVHYGANGTFTVPRAFSAAVACTNSVFGDPVPGVAKRCEYRDVSSGSTSTPPPPPPPPPSSGGTSLDDFTDFQNNAFGEIFINRWRIPPGKNWTALSYTGETWPSGGGVWQTSTPHGPGFRFVATDEMLNAPDRKAAQIADIDHFVDQQGYLGTVTELSGKLMLPASGNQAGFAPNSDWNALWEFGPGLTSNNQFGIDGNVNKFYVRSYAPGQPDNRRKAVAPNTIQLDRWYDWRWQIKWSSGSDGFVNFWIDGVQLAQWTGPTVPSGVEPPWIQWGYYGSNSKQRNEVLYAALRKA